MHKNDFTPEFDSDDRQFFEWVPNRAEEWEYVFDRPIHEINFFWANERD